MADLNDFVVIRVDDGSPDVRPVLPVKDLLPRGRTVRQTVQTLRDDMLVQSGDYVHTIRNDTNIASSTPIGARFLRIGAYVYVSGTALIDPTAADIPVVFGISLPFASNFTGLADANGMVGHEVGDFGTIQGDSGNDDAEGRFTPTSASSRQYMFNFVYLIK